MSEVKSLVKDDKGVWMVTARLLEPAPRPKRHRRQYYNRRTRAWLLDSQGHRCAICRGPLSLLDSHVDHIIPLVAGGEESLTNLQLTHPHCNMRKGGASVGRDREGMMPWA